MLSTFVSILAVFHQMVLVSGANPIIMAKSGRYQGVDSPVDGVVKYLAIPYANPPVGSQRFKLPKLINPHDGLYKANRRGPMCPQTVFPLGDKYDFLFPENQTQSEDCLMLDIYVPKPASSENTKAVLVWIHGGGYLFGSGGQYESSYLTWLNDIVVVTINYRLGVLGFLSTLDENAPGNFGLYDQITALQWIQENIEAFGGDKNRVTIAGESAGGSSASQLSLMAAGEGLFHRVIAQSGTFSNPWAHAGDPVRYANSVAVGTGCPTNDTKRLVQCLRDVPYEKLLPFQFPDLTKMESKWAPAYNSETFPFTLSEFLENWTNLSIVRQFSEMDVLGGVCSEEGAISFEYLSPAIKHKNNYTGEGIPENILQELITRMIGFILPELSTMPQTILHLVRYMYTDHSKTNDTIALAQKCVQLLSDSMFNVALSDFVNIHLESAVLLNSTDTDSPRPGNTFVYRYNQPGSWMSTKPWRTGANHGDDLFFLFGSSLREGSNSTEAEKYFTHKYMRYWGNFVKTGNPNGEGTDNTLPEWPPYEKDNPVFMELDTNLSENSVKSRLFPERVAFWTDVIRPQIKLVQNLLERCDRSCS